MKYFFLIRKNLTSKKLRLLLLIISISVSFILYTLLSSFQNAINAGIEISGDNRLVVINKINFTQPLPKSYFDRIQQVEGVREIAHFNWFGGYYQEPRNIVSALVVSMETFLSVYDEFVISEREKKSLLSNRRGLLVGESIARDNGWKVGDRISLFSNIYEQKTGGNSWEFDVSAIYSGRDAQVDTNAIYIHYPYFNESITLGENQIGWITLLTEDKEINEQVIRKIDSLSENSSFETETMPEKAFAKQFIEQIGNLGLIIRSVVFVGFFTVLLLVGNAMMMSFRERNRDIATLKAIGFTSRQISSIILIESLLLVFIGGVLGLLITDSLIAVINVLPGNSLPPFVLSFSTFVQAIGIMIALGILCGIIPAYNALKLNVSDIFARN